MAWKSNTYVGDPSPVAVGDTVAFTGANYGATRVSTGLSIMFGDNYEYNLSENKARASANGKVWKGSETRSAYVGRRVKIIGDPTQDLRVNFSYSNAARSRIYGAGTARSTTILSVLRDGTGIPDASSPDVVNYTYPLNLTPSTTEIVKQQSESDLYSMIVQSDDLQDEDILRIGVGAFAGISTYASAQTVADISDDNDISYDGMIEYSAIELEWVDSV